VAIDTRAQLIEVATSAFARDGVASTSLRAIAKEAGVSPALVVHHFGSRKKLIEDCIIKALGLWVSEKQEFVDVSLSTALSKWQGAIAEHGVKLQFFRQVLIAGGEPANILFSRMVKESEMMIQAQIDKGQMRKIENLPDLALLMTLHGLAPLIMQDQVNNQLGGNFLEPELGSRLTSASLEIYRRGIYKNTEDKALKKKKKKAGKK
jgi:AcrR family transcriptional regulator